MVYRESRRTTALIRNLVLEWGHLWTSDTGPFSSRKELLYQLEAGGGFPQPGWTFWKTHISCPYRNSNPISSSPYTHYAISAASADSQRTRKYYDRHNLIVRRLHVSAYHSVIMRFDTRPILLTFYILLTVHPGTIRVYNPTWRTF